MTTPNYDPELAGMGRDQIIEKLHAQDEKIEKQEKYILHLRESWDRAEEKWRSITPRYASEREQRQNLQVQVRDLDTYIDRLERKLKALAQLESCDGSVSISRGPSGEFRVRVLNGCSFVKGDPVVSATQAAILATPAVEDADLCSAILQAFSAGDHP